MVARVSSPVFVGRVAEIAELEAVLHRAVAGRPATVVVAGEAGVGKTRLVAELVSRAGAQGMTTLTGACLDVGDGVLPYAPVVEALRQVGRLLDEAELDRVLGDARAFLARLVPELASPRGDAGHLAGADPDASGRMFELLLGVVHRLAAREPLLLVMEDLQWADRSTRDLLGFLIRNTRARVLLVLTYRTDDVHSRHPLRAFLAELTRSGRVERVELARFARRELAQLLGAIFGRQAPPDVVGEIMARSDGNAFYAEELLAAHRQGADMSAALRELVLARVQKLARPAQQVVAAAVVAGRRVDHDLLAEVTGLAPDVLVARLREAVDHHVLVAGNDLHAGGYALRHALLQEAVYDDLLAAQRIRLHGAYARAMTRRLDAPGAGAPAGTQSAVEAGQLAHHWHAANDLGQAVPAYARAGVAAENAAAPAEALRYYELAAALWEQAPHAAAHSPMDRAALLGRAAEAAYLTGDPERAITLARQALAQIDPADRLKVGAVLVRMARYHWDAADTPQATAAIEQAAALIPDEPASRQRAGVLAADARLLMLQGRYEEARQRCRHAVAVAREVGADAEEGRALNTLGVANAYLGRTEDAIADLERARHIAEQFGGAEDLCRAYNNLALTLAEDGRHADAASLGLEACRLTRRLGLVRGYGVYNQTGTAAALMTLGRWEEADRLLDELFELDPSTAAQFTAFETRAAGRLWRGDLAAAHADLAALWKARAGLHPEAAADLCRQLAEVHIWQGRLSDAGATVSEGLKVAEVIQPSTLVELCVVGLCAEAAIAEEARARHATGQHEAAVARGAVLLRHVRDAATAFGPATTRRMTAELATAEAEWTRITGVADASHWRDVADAWESVGLHYRAAYARWRQAEALLAAGTSRQPAAAVITDAWNVCGRFGFRALASELESLARRARVELPGPSIQADDPAGDPAEQHPDAPDQFHLTPREREVLAFLTEGRTNRQIAERLYISDKTASVHVSNILAKLGVANRGEAAAVAHRLGLVK